MKLTKDNVKVGDKLYVYPSDSRQRPWYFTVSKIGRKYIVDNYGVNKIEIGTNEIYRKDGIGAVENVYLSEEEYHKEREIINKHTSFVNRLHSSSNIYRKMSDEDIDAITKIMCKYDKEWATR